MKTFVKSLDQKSSKSTALSTIDKYGADEMTPLIRAISNNDIKAASDALDKKADPNKSHKTTCASPVSHAVLQNSSELVFRLLALGADLNSSSVPDGVTPLITACVLGHSDIALKLLQSKANPNLSMVNNVTPLWSASLQGNLPIVSHLINYKADVNQSRYDDGSTPLFMAVKYNYIEVAEKLLENKADINKPRKTDGFTPIILASSLGNLEMTQLLLMYGADITLLTTTGKSASDVAITSDIRNLLEIYTQLNSESERLLATKNTKHLFQVSTLKMIILGGLGIKCAHLINKEHLATLQNILQRYRTEVINLSQMHIVDRIYGFYHKYKNAFDLPNIESVNYSVKEGVCSGKTSLFLMACALHKNEDQKFINLDDIPNDFRHHPPAHNLATFRLSLEVISTWDKKRDLSEKEKYLFCLMIYQLVAYQHPIDFNQADLHRFFPRLEEECEPYAFCATEAKLSDLIDIMVRPERMVRMSSSRHEFGIYKSSVNSFTYYESNERRGWVTVADSKTLAQKIFQFHKNSELNYDPRQFSPFNFRMFIHRDRKKEVYPNPAELYSKLQLADNKDEKNANGWTGLHAAAECGDTRSMQYFLDQKTDVNAKESVRGHTPLRLASAKLHLEVSKLLLKNGADPNIVDKNNYYPIDIPVIENKLDLLRVLLENKANPNFPSGGSKQTPLMRAAYYGHSDCVSLLLEYKADPTFTYQGISAIYFASQEGCFKILAEIISHCKKHQIKFNIDCVWEKDGSTPLTAAIKRNHPNVVQYLLDNGANPNVMDFNGFTPLRIVDELKLGSIMRDMILDAGKYLQKVKLSP